MKKVVVVELGLCDRMVPLLGGYLEAYAGRDPWLKASYRFEKFSAMPSVDERVFTRRLADEDADVYAFSCYVWNSRRAMSIMRGLLAARPEARFMLGGPQVMHQGQRYLQPEYENVAVCNGEGEIPFSDYLRELCEARPDLHKVPGISFYDDGTLVTTERRTRLVDIDEIPSPFLGGLFQGQFRMTVFETNRGCPFRCGFCYWGAATNDRVYKFSEDRLREELTWIAKRGVVPYVYIADANWGLLNRDVELSRFIADCRAQYHVPQMVYFSSAKNSPGRVCEIMEIFQAANIITAQPISLQTLDDEALRMVDRQNIKRSAFMQIQKRLNEQRFSSYTELIWPLPGETIVSFRAGIQELCRIGSSTSTHIVYPYFLLPNTPMDRHRDELGLVTRRIDADGHGEGDVIVQTPAVSPADYDDGLRFYYAACLLYNVRGMRATAAYLDRTGLASYTDLMLAFITFWRAHALASPLIAFIEQTSIRDLGAAQYTNIGKLCHYALHEQRTAFEQLCQEFIASQPWSADDAVRFVHEMDRVLLPYVYSSTPVAAGGAPFEFLDVAAAESRTFELTVPARFAALFAEIMEPYGLVLAPDGLRYRIDHRRLQYPYSAARGLETNADYCYGMLIRVESILPAAAAIEEPPGSTDADAS